jgi:large subunit ribosomal protein L24
MKREFSLSWNASKQPRKQRKYRAKAPLHIKKKMVSANLSKELHKKYEKKSFPVRKGDTVRIMKGEFKKKTGKIETVNLGTLKVIVEGIYRTKKDGTKVGVHFDPSNLQIKDLNLEDEKRKTALGRKATEKKKASPKQPLKEEKKTETNKSENKEGKK